MSPSFLSGLAELPRAGQTVRRENRYREEFMSTQPTVAVLGLGAMGYAFAANLISAGLPTRVWNRTRSKAENLGRNGATVCNSPREAAESADVVITMVPDAPTTEEVLLGDNGALEGLKQQGVVAQMGTIGVEPTEQLIRRVKDKRPDVVFIDAPVSGTKAPAEQGQVVVLASGDRDAAPGIEPVFEAISKAVKWQGQAGAGSRMKLVVNAWLIHMMEGVAETAQLAEQLGFSIDDFWNTLDGGPLAAPYVKVKLGMIDSGNFDAQMALEWGLKDARLALEAAGDLDMPALRRISETWSKAVDAGHGDADISIIYHYLKNRG
ncbi:NAD(P)-dependent oxidoreductase [Kushneria phosphatilytica]|uniref:NAD(P)-dependent oxidoreductase n=2 Tax=Kushneria phosphatilytica TaxID=657387 RepID=A0A5C0ZT76_9GAMM|nr:NAD(P)-dependent oxidoreductase [Kushneria phosphatilytica]QEL09720.1 NAD(P)-dependent oxidoreductase [Kushneria phosphatilytica]